MKKILVVWLLVCVSTSLLLAQEGTVVAESPDTSAFAAGSNISNEILSPFYERTAERFSDGQIHYVNSECYFELNSFDGGTGLHHIEYAVDNGVYSLYTTPFRISTQGNHLIRYRALDTSGNIEKAVLYQVYVDNTSAAVSIGSDRELYINGDYLYCNYRTKFYIAAADDDSGAGIKQTYAGTKIDAMSAKGTGISSAANFFKVADGEEGVHEFYYTSLDNVGNMSEIKKYNIIVDNTPPLIEIDSNDWINMTAEGMRSDMNLKVSPDAIVIVPDLEDENKFFVNGNHTLAFKGIDPKIGNLNGSGVATLYVKINDEDFVKYKGPIQFQKAKIYNILVKAEDNAGNISAESEFIFDLDFIRPDSDMIITNSDGQAVIEKE